MRIFIISDTHGHIEKAAELYSSLKDIDLIVHLGDFYSDAQELERQLGVTVLKVKGNMDGAFYREGYQILETEFGKVFVAHGHMESVKDGPHNILYKAESLGCKAVFYGHTHVPVYVEVEGMYLLNPGSLTLPIGGRAPSYAIATLEKDSLSASILYVEPDLKQEGESAIGDMARKTAKNAKPEPRYLKNMLNYSDRF